jgi:hypothetical protein
MKSWWIGCEHCNGRGYIQSTELPPLPELPFNNDDMVVVMNEEIKIVTTPCPHCNREQN